jgi:TatD DNase family protein
MTLTLFDTHAHLESSQISPLLDSILSEADQDELVGIMAIGTDARDSSACAALAKQHPLVYASAGLHPNHCKSVTRDDFQVIKELVAEPKVVAIGETGLDRHWDDCPFDIQLAWFKKHIELSFETELPLVIHTRACEKDMVETLESNARDGRIIGIMHSFACSIDAAKRCLDLGMYISFAGMVTFKNSHELRDIAKQIPDERLLIETDSPYLSPHPLRSKRPNKPAYVRHTAQCLADVRGVSLESIGQLTTENARRVFGLSEDH